MLSACGSAPPATSASRTSKSQTKSALAASTTAASSSPAALPAAGSCAQEAPCRRACEAGDAPACGRLSRLLFQGKDGRRDEIAARVAADHACGLGSPEGCVVRGELALTGDPRAAGRYFRQACNDGHPDGCALLGVLTVDGRGVPKDPELAVGFWERSCKAGSAIGCHNLAFAYERGTHLPGDDARAAKLHERACSLGSASSCRDLGQMQDEGRGVPEDRAAARSHFAKGCDGGDPLACSSLESLEDRVLPVEKVYVRVIDIGYAGPRFSKSQRDKPAAKRRAQAAAMKLNSGGDFASIAVELGDTGPTPDRERLVYKQKTSSPFLDAAFALAPRKASVVDHPLFGFQVVYRTR